jgi:UDP-glucose 4-epimerase
MTEDFRRACVTGGAGFIGTQLVRSLLARGLDVTVLDNLSVGHAENVPPKAVLIEGDILDAASVRRAQEGCDIVFHLAARVAIRSSFEFVVEDTMTNVAGTASVLRAAQKAGSVRKVVTASSMAVYADAEGSRPVPEDHSTEPISPYGISKLAAEALTHSMCSQAELESVVLRLFNTYGPGQALSPYVGVVTIFVDKLNRGEAPTVFGDGRQCRDFVHVEDVAAGFLAAMKKEASGRTFNIGTGTSTSVNEVLQHLQAAMGTSLAERHAEAVPGELRYSIADIGRARSLLGFEPKHRFRDSVPQVVRDILKTCSS